MNRFAAIILAFVIIFCSTACQEVQMAPGVLYIKPAELTEQENKIALLLGSGTNSPIFDFCLDASAKSVQFNCYQLKDGKWDLISGGGGRELSQAMGRIALKFENIPEGLRTAIQCGNDFSATGYSSRDRSELDNMACATSTLSQTIELSYDKEVALAVQVFNSKNQLRTFSVDMFDSPEDLVERDYDRVYAITVMFSQKSVGELSK